MTQPEPPWSIILARQAETTLRRLPPASFRLLDRQISALAENPRPLECQRLVGYGNLYRLRISEWRIAYAVEEERRLVFILEIVPKQQPERYRLDFEEIEIKGEGTLEAESLDVLDLVGKLEVLRNLIPDLNQPETAADLVRNLELLKRLASAQLEAITQVQPGYTAWYLLCCVSGSEHDLKQKLLRRVQRLGLADKVLRVVVPGEAEKQAASFSFYGFILVEMVPDEEAWEIIKTTSGVSAYLGSGNRPTPLQPDQIDSLLRDIREIPRPPLQVEVAAGKKIHLFIKTNALPLRSDLYKMIETEADLELVDEAGEADIVLSETVTLPKDVFSRNTLVDSMEAELSSFSSESWDRTGQTLLVVQDLANYLASPAGLSDSLRVPFSKEELLGLIHRMYDQSQTEDTMSSVLKPLKTLRLGRWVELSLSVTDLAASLLFYKKLGLKQVDAGETPYRWAVVSDAVLHLGLYQDPFPSPTLSYFSWGEDLSLRVTILKRFNISMDRPVTQIASQWPSPGNVITAAEFTAFEGQRVYLCSHWRERMNIGKSFFTFRNKFGELSLKTADVKAATNYWERLGFKRIAGSDKPYPWATLSDDLIRLGLHQTTRFTHPTISYFSPDMPDRLQRLREQDIPFLSEYKDAQGRTIGAVVRSPDGQPFFLFTGQPAY